MYMTLYYCFLLSQLHLFSKSPPLSMLSVEMYTAFLIKLYCHRKESSRVQYNVTCTVQCHGIVQCHVHGIGIVITSTY